jgi:hypothetical protein
LNKFVFKYSIEFIVLLTGLLLTFYIEDLNQHRHKIELKNQSLSRLIKNVEEDIIDHKINLSKVQFTIDYHHTLRDRGLELFNTNKDSLGYYLTAISRTSTIFYANQEEYITLRNSGYIELIENDSLVNYLQRRHSTYVAFKKMEDKIIDYEREIVNMVNNKTGIRALGYIFFSGYDHGTYSSYNYKYPLTDVELNKIGYSANQSRFYKPLILGAIQNDSLLIELIHREISV